LAKSPPTKEAAAAPPLASRRARTARGLRFAARAGNVATDLHGGCHMVTRYAAALLMTLLSTTATAGEPKAFVCSFPAGLAHVYEKGRFATEEAAPINFGIEAIDTAAQTADLKMPRGTGHLRIVQAVNAMHFLEVVTEGFLNVTTIYDKDETKGSYPAVHSRHFGLLGQPIVSQYTGYCSGTE
jgi:hypothetical protein